MGLIPVANTRVRPTLNSKPQLALAALQIPARVAEQCALSSLVLQRLKDGVPVHRSLGMDRVVAHAHSTPINTCCSIALALLGAMGQG